MSFVLEPSCWLYKRMLPLHADNLRYRLVDTGLPRQKPAHNPLLARLNS